MSTNDEDQGWQTVGDRDGGDRRHNRRNDVEGENENVGNNNRRGNDYEEGDHRPRRRNDNESNGEEWPSLGGNESSERRPGYVEEASTWRPNLHSHTQEHQEKKESKFSMRGMFSALKTTVKAKVHEVLHELTAELRNNFKLPASEQHYAETVSSDVDTSPTDSELEDIVAACAKLWDVDINRLTPGQDYEIDCGDGKKMYQKEDMVENALFKHLDPSVFRRPTFARFIALLDNYSASMNETERRTRQEEQEELAFIEEISRTAPIQYLQRYLSSKGIVRGGDEDFKRTLHSLWFKMFDRSGTDDSSSAFEHVFVGEIKRGRDDSSEVSGLHNWIQFYLEEAKGRLDYQGFILPRRRGDELPDSQSQLLTVQFKWNNFLKPLSSTLIGVSPEFELALYTLCFYCGQENNHVQLGPYSVNIKVYPLGRNGIGSAFPIAEE